MLAPGPRRFARPSAFSAAAARDTAYYEYLVLPATSPLEHEDAVLAYGGDFGGFSPRAIAPLGEAKSNAEVFQLLGRTLGLTEPALYVSAAELMAEALTP